jgi:5-methylcytosine-specific restriction enzyme B
MADRAWTQKYLGQRYRDYLRAPNSDRYTSFRDYCVLTQRIAENLKNANTRDDVEAACQAAGSTSDAFIEDAWYERWNGVSSLKQGGLSQKTFETVKESGEFWALVSQAMAAANPNQPTEHATVSTVYTQTMDWMSRFAEHNQVSRFPAAVNRFFAGCFPGKLTTIAAESHFRTLLMSLDAGEFPDFLGDWLNSNWVLLEWLSAALGPQIIEHDDEFQRSIFFWWLYENLAGHEDRQVIYFGSPGTGKTWKAGQVAQSRIKSWRQQYGPDEETTSRMGNQIERVQFHPSYGYEDFVEGIRPVFGTSGRHIELNLKSGIFKHFCRRAAQWEIDFFQSTGKKITDTTTVGDTRNHLPLLDPAAWSFLSTALPTSDRVIDHLPPYVFIVDEINRAELSRVMGELMFSLEYRGIEGKIKTQYSELVKDKNHDCAFLFDVNSGSNFFFIPYNLYFFGTMNTIDRSVDSFDFALRRRFRWEELKFDQAAATDILDASGVNGQSAELIINAINRVNGAIIRDKFLGSDYCVGHAYLKHMAEYRGPRVPRAYLEFMWQTRLEPLLREYFRGSTTPFKLRDRVDEFRNVYFG